MVPDSRDWRTLENGGENAGYSVAEDVTQGYIDPTADGLGAEDTKVEE